MSNATLGKIEPGRSVYLHIINLKPLFKADSDETKFIRTNLTYGFITPKPLPNTCSFPIFIKRGTINVSILNNKNIINLSQRKIKEIKEFNLVVFNEVLNVLNDYFILDHSENAESLLLVPVNREKLDIDHKILKENREMVSTKYSDKAEIVNNKTYLHKIINPAYRMGTSVRN